MCSNFLSPTRVPFHGSVPITRSGDAPTASCHFSLPKTAAGCRSVPPFSSHCSGIIHVHNYTYFCEWRYMICMISMNIVFFAWWFQVIFAIRSIHSNRAIWWFQVGSQFWQIDTVGDLILWTFLVRSNCMVPNWYNKHYHGVINHYRS